MANLQTTSRRVGGWCILMGTVTITVGLAVGVGCLVAGGVLRKKSHQ